MLMYFYIRAYDLNNMYFNVCSFPWSCMHQASMYGESKILSSCYICACAFCIFYICVVPCVFAPPFSFPVLPSVFLSRSVSLPDRDKTHGLTSSTRMIQTYQKRLAFYMRLRIKTHSQSTCQTEGMQGG